jgi:hypothetical protein
MDGGSGQTSIIGWGVWSTSHCANAPWSHNFLSQGKFVSADAQSTFSQRLPRLGIAQGCYNIKQIEHTLLHQDMSSKIAGECAELLGVCIALLAAKATSYKCATKHNRQVQFT